MIGEDELLKYYEKGWELGLLELCNQDKLENSLFKFRILAVIDLMQLTSNRIFYILDAGCGVGTTSILISQKYKNTKFCCIDISRIQIEAGRKYVQSKGISDKFEFLVGDVCKSISTSYDIQKFDFVIASEVIEHLVRPDRMLENLRNLGDKSTKFIFSVPLGKSKNNDIAYRIIKEDGKSIVAYDPSKLDKNKNYHKFYHKLYSLNDAKNVLFKNGYKIIKIIGTGFLLNKSLGYYMNRITKYSYGFDKFINKITFNKFADSAIFLCQSV